MTMEQFGDVADFDFIVPWQSDKGLVDRSLFARLDMDHGRRRGAAAPWRVLQRDIIDQVAVNYAVESQEAFRPAHARHAANLVDQKIVEVFELVDQADQAQVSPHP